MQADELAKRYRVEDGVDFRLDKIDPADTDGLDIEKSEAKELLEHSVKRLRKLQERLYAGGDWAILIVLQAMDTAGKDSAIEHVMSGINPQGCDVRAFKVPSTLELQHDFLWRHERALPARGRIGIFNRSHYEEVLAVRVHPELLEKQNLPDEPAIWTRRFQSIRAFEEHLANNGTMVLKFFLHISPDEQARRLLSRIDDPDKNWKFSFGDIAERKLWDHYMDAYEDMIRNTARPHAPWYVVPSNNKWYSRLLIAAAIADAMESLDLKFPTVSEEMRQEMLAARDALARDAEGGNDKKKKKK